MYETDDDLRALQELLDASYARSGEHLRSIWGEDSRLDARGLCSELVGVQVLDLGTVTARGEPRVSPVDGLFFRGHLWFGSADNSARFRNIRAKRVRSAAVLNTIGMLEVAALAASAPVPMLRSAIHP